MKLLYGRLKASAAESLLQASDEPKDLIRMYAVDGINLNLSLQSLSGFPEDIAQRMPALRFLCLGHNRIKKIPSSIILRLVYLETLEMDNNLLRRVPKAIGVLVSLKTLVLSYNRIIFVTRKIANLQSLTMFSLSNNQLDSIPCKQIGRLSTLQRLNLSFNRLGIISPSLFESHLAGSLQVLDLSHNSLTGALPESLGRLTTLTTLDISFNAITTLPPQHRQSACPQDLRPLSQQPQLSPSNTRQPQRPHLPEPQQEPTAHVFTARNWTAGVTSSLQLHGQD